MQTKLKYATGETFETDWNRILIQLTAPALLVFGMADVARAQQTLPDAQVESNVLKALAGATELANETITTRTVYGTVTLTGTVRDEATRRRAETLAADADGVKKVVDQLALVSQTDRLPPAGMVLQPDGTYALDRQAQTQPQAASAPQRNDPEHDQALDHQREVQDAPSTGSQTAGTQDPNAPQPRYQPQYPADGRRPLTPPVGYPQSAHYPPYPQYSQGGYGATEQARNTRPAPEDGQTYGGQPGGLPVTIPAGAMLRVRLSQGISSDRSQIGGSFAGVVVNDVIADGSVAIPRGAAVTGKVIDARASGNLKGRGQLSIQLTSVTLGGRLFPIETNVWDHHGGDKTTETIDKTAGFGAVGALLGALAGGGVGAAVGGGLGAAAGLGSSAASGRGEVYLPVEGLVAFNLAQPASVVTVTEREMQRLAYGVGPNGPDGSDRRGPRARTRIYYGPQYYPGYYPGPYFTPYGTYGRPY